MIQFTEQEINRLKEKGEKHPYILDLLKEKAREIYEGEILVPESGIGNWYMYYFCSECSLPLTFDRHKPHSHKCEKCQKVYNGEPFDSSWWGQVNKRNYEGCYHMALYHVLTGDESYSRKAIDIMLEYSKYYEGYEVHGDIPYNGPGKAGAQTLDESIFIRTFALTYDLLQDVMTAAEKAQIGNHMLIPGGEFLMEHRHNQIHNHEVITNSAIAVVGILFTKEEFIQFALYQSYGMVYQLEHGMLADNMWFEGTFGYHYYALENFFAFEKFAIHTEYSNIHHPNYQQMMELVLDYLMPDNTFPLLNDTYIGHGKLANKTIYEFFYAQVPSERLLEILNVMYQDNKRENPEAFFYGVDELPKRAVALKDYHSDKGAGNTIFRGKDERYLIFRHGQYGGEHDHYDRLDIAYVSHGRRIAPDIGTTGYGAVLHYDYYKNTASHNTVCINEENQPPACGQVLRFEEIDGIKYIEAMVDFGAPYEMPDSFTIVQWDKDSYKNVRMVRKIAWAEDFFVEMFLVDRVDNLDIDWIFHFGGTRESTFAGERPVGQLSKKKPLKYLHNVTELQGEDYVKNTFAIDGVKADLHSYLNGKKMLLGAGPDNPSVQDMAYVIERMTGKAGLFFHVVESYGERPTIDKVEFVVGEQEGTAIIWQQDKQTKITFSACLAK